MTDQDFFKALSVTTFIIIILLAVTVAVGFELLIQLVRWALP